MKKNKRPILQPRKIEIDYSEKWGKDVEEAVRLALMDLKLSREEVNVTVLEEPVRGFLGIGAKLAKVRVEKIKVSESRSVQKKESIGERAGKKDDNLIRGKESRKTRQSDDISVEENTEATTRQKHQVRDFRKKKNEEESKADVDIKSDKSSDANKGKSSSHSRGSKRRDSGSRQGRIVEDRQDGRTEQQKESLSGTETKTNSYVKDHVSPERTKSLPSGHPGLGAGDKKEKLSISKRPTNLVPVSAGNAADIFFREIIEKMLLDINIKSFENEECVYLEVEGKDSRTVIGKRGQTLDAIQYLTNLVMNKNRDSYIRVIVDVEGYRSRRERTLESLALKLSGKVEKTGRSVRLEPMNPYERKVIHSTLQSNPRINTRSEGEEPYRRVIIEKK